jgi:hypothetical protein
VRQPGDATVPRRTRLHQLAAFLKLIPAPVSDLRLAAEDMSQGYLTYVTRSVGGLGSRRLRCIPHRWPLGDSEMTLGASFGLGGARHVTPAVRSTPGAVSKSRGRGKLLDGLRHLPAIINDHLDIHGP